MTVTGIWWAGLLITLLVFVPLAVYLLHQLWRSARNIQIYAREALDAASGIANNTEHIVGLDTTIEAAGTTLSTAGAIERKLGGATAALARRAGGR